MAVRLLGYRMRRGAVELAFLGAVVAFVALFAVVPAAVLFTSASESVGGWGAATAVVTAPVNTRALENSLLQGSLSGLLAVAIGYPAGVFVGRYAWPGRSILRSLLLVPFLLPSLVVVFGVIDLFGPGGAVAGPIPSFAWFGSGVPGIVGANLLYNVPLVILFTANGTETASRDLEETVASLGGSPARAYLEVWSRPSWAGATTGGLLTFVFSALSFAPPLLLCTVRCDTVEVQIYSLDQFLLEPGAAGLLALVTVAIFLVPAVAYLLLVRRLRPSPGARPPRSRPVPWRSPIAWGLAGITAGVVAAEGAVLGAVLYRSLLPRGSGTFGTGWTELLAPTTAARLGLSVPAILGNTLFFAALAAIVSLLIGIASGFALVRRPRISLPFGLLLFVPILLSPVVVAYSFADFWRPLLGGEANVWLLIVLSQALLALPFAVQTLEVSLAGLSRGAREAAETLGASPWGAFVDADLPRVPGGLSTAALFALALGLGEFTATFFLVTPRFTTLPVATYTLAGARLAPAADAAAGLLLGLSVLVYVAIAVGGRRVRL